MTYTTCIVPYLAILGQFDAAKMREIEQELIDELKKVDCSEARYRRYKTDRDHSIPLHHLEAETIYNFFVERFNCALKEADDDRMIDTLEAWMPTSTLEIYWKLQGAQAARAAS